MTFPGHISETAEPISIEFSPLIVMVFRSLLLVLLKSDKDKDSFPASMPSVFIRRNTVCDTGSEDTLTRWSKTIFFWIYVYSDIRKQVIRQR